MYDKKQVKSLTVPTPIAILMVTTTLFLVFAQFVVSLRYEPIAQIVGVMDAQSRRLNTTYLDYEEQNAILRSSKFLVNEKASGYVSAPTKVLYVNPSNTIVSSN
ncbi:hypothetical protein IT418_03200 [bacterium]|nr:hypothetical protein [bacterium]